MGTLTFQAALGGSVNLLGPNTASNINFTLPSADGTSGQPLLTNGSGTLSFANLAIANGGTGATSFTANQIHYGSFSQSAGLTFDGTNFATTGTATATKLIPTGTSVTGNGMYLPATNALGFSTNGTNAVYIDASQNVGIGTSSPSTYVANGGLALAGAYGTSSTALAISNTTAYSASNIARFNFRLNNSFGGLEQVASITALNPNAAANNGGALTFATSANGTATTPTERMRIDNVGIVTMSYYGVGTATFSASGVISSVSDETWKIKDGIPVDPDSMLKKLEPGYWYYNDEKKEIFGVDRQLGFYAQNVNAALGPEAAPTPEEGKPWGYYDRSVLAVTVMSLQKALATIETLTARIEALEAK